MEQPLPEPPLGPDSDSEPAAPEKKAETFNELGWTAGDTLRDLNDKEAEIMFITRDEKAAGGGTITLEITDNKGNTRTQDVTFQQALERQQSVRRIEQPQEGGQKPAETPSASRQTEKQNVLPPPAPPTTQSSKKRTPQRSTEGLDDLSQEKQAEVTRLQSALEEDIPRIGSVLRQLQDPRLVEDFLSGSDARSNGAANLARTYVNNLKLYMQDLSSTEKFREAITSSGLGTIQNMNSRVTQRLSRDTDDAITALKKFRRSLEDQLQRLSKEN